MAASVGFEDDLSVDTPLCAEKRKHFTDVSEPQKAMKGKKVDTPERVNMITQAKVNEFMKKVKKTGKQQKKLLQKKKGNDMELESGKSKAQLAKEGANKAQIEVPNRTVNLLGKRCSPPENTRSHITSKKAQKQEHKNPEEAIDS